MGVGKPIAGAGKPVTGAGKPMTGAGKPMAGAGKPMAGAGKPMTGAGKPMHSLLPVLCAPSARGILHTHSLLLVLCSAGAREILEYAQAVVQEPGSCTATIGILKPQSNTLEVRLGGGKRLGRGRLGSTGEKTARGEPFKDLQASET